MSTLILRNIVKVRRVGTSLCFTIPSSIVKTLNMSSNSVLFVYVDEGGLVYSLTPTTHRFKIVKLRIASKQNNRTYFVVTIPKEFSEQLNINVDDYVFVECYKNKLIVRKA